MKIAIHWKEILSIILFIFIICIEFAYRKPAYDYSLEFILSWQERKNDSLKNFFIFISAFGTPTVIAGIFVIIYCFATRRLIIKTIFIIFVSQNFIGFFKIFYHNPRPYLSSEEIKAMNCAEGYGNPSGHCLFVSSFYLGMWIILFPNNTEPGKPLFSERWVRLLIEWITFFIVIALILLTFFARMYLGAHGLNQTIYGITIGLWVAYTCGVVLIPYVDNHFDIFVKSGRLFSRFNLGFLLVIVIFISLQIWNIILFFSLRNKADFMTEEWTRRLEMKCPDLDTTPFEDSFKAGLHASIYPFAYFSQLFNARIFFKAFRYWYSNIGFPKLALRTLIVIIVLAICFIPYLVTHKYSFTIKMVIGVLLNNIIITVVGIPFIDWITEKLNLIELGYDMKEEKEKEISENTYGTV